MKLIVSGGKKLAAQLTKLPKQFMDASAEGQLQAQQAVLKLAKSWAPFEEGTLEESGFIQGPSYTNKSVSVTVGFGGAATPYMVAQHEGVYNHPGLNSKTKNPGRAAQGRRKFLELAVQELSQKTRDTIVKVINRFLRSGR